MAKIATKKVIEDAVVFAFEDGEKFTCSIAALDKAIVLKLALHGISQKVGDSYASADSIEAGRQAAELTWKNLTAGVWASARGGLLVDALQRATGKTYEECMDKVAGMDDEEKKALRKHPAIKSALADIAQEKAQAAAAFATGEDSPDLTELFK